MHPLFYYIKEESITIRIRKGKAKTKPTAPKERVNHEIDVSPIRLIDENGNLKASVHPSICDEIRIIIDWLK